MKIGLIDVDGHNFPNLALMKIAGWHKQQGDMTEWAFAFNEYDRIYKSKVFTFTPDDLTAYQCPDIRKGKSDEAHRKLHALGIKDYTELAITEIIE